MDSSAEGGSRGLDARPTVVQAEDLEFALLDVVHQTSKQHRFGGPKSQSTSHFIESDTDHDDTNNTEQTNNNLWAGSQFGVLSKFDVRRMLIIGRKLAAFLVRKRSKRLKAKRNRQKFDYVSLKQIVMAQQAKQQQSDSGAVGGLDSKNSESINELSSLQNPNSDAGPTSIMRKTTQQQQQTGPPKFVVVTPYKNKVSPDGKSSQQDSNTVLDPDSDQQQAETNKKTGDTDNAESLVFNGPDTNRSNDTKISDSTVSPGKVTVVTIDNASDSHLTLNNNDNNRPPVRESKKIVISKAELRSYHILSNPKVAALVYPTNKDVVNTLNNLFIRRGHKTELYRRKKMIREHLIQVYGGQGKKDSVPIAYKIQDSESASELVISLLNRIGKDMNDKSNTSILKILMNPIVDTNHNSLETQSLNNNKQINELDSSKLQNQKNQTVTNDMLTSMRKSKLKLNKKYALRAIEVGNKKGKMNKESDDLDLSLDIVAGGGQGKGKKKKSKSKTKKHNDQKESDGNIIDPDDHDSYSESDSNENDDENDDIHKIEDSTAEFARKYYNKYGMKVGELQAMIKFEEAAREREEEERIRNKKGICCVIL